MEWVQENVLISDDKSKIDIEKVCQLLRDTYWANDRSVDIIQKSMDHSIVFGVYTDEKQIGFARVISDQAVFSWLLDVVIDPEYQGKTIGTFLVESILKHPAVEHTKFALATKDAHSFYEKFDFMERAAMTRN
ncbi:GNAT family N-acetyltransferase [Gracilibacillus caseinilyticus]|uniref:GNAT family N-acetyltransferase n=1 Tax=Gracilibacillus caseinilyticus TaxID=2932256 RepID=A0ABY4ER14_9BACI|nr:GNAT family N-acetyltransferase [Gracilibacillus caseinilyticus]UOQ46800.1 GNAT family N-acetyltransferase [Gracilibacillus caseinilyticus]